MGLAALRRSAEQQDDHIDEFDRNLDAARAIPRPHDPDWIGTIYYDPKVFPVPSMLDRIGDRYVRLYPGREFVFRPLSPGDLESWAPIPFGKADAEFRQRGFVSDVDILNVGTGGAVRDNTYQKRNKAAADHLLAKLESFATHRNAVGAWFWQRQLNNTALAGLIGFEGQLHVPLIEFDGMLLPSRNITEGDITHACYYRAPNPAMKDGSEDKFELTSALSEEIADQGVFEIQRATELFECASSLAVLLWQTQALAALRKAAWHSGLDEHIYALTNAFEKEKAASRDLIRQAGILQSWISIDIRVTNPDRRRFGRNVIVGSVSEIEAATQRDAIRAQNGDLDYDTQYVIMIDSVQVRLINQIEETYAGIAGVRQMGFRLGYNTLKRHLTLDQIIVAALHGATYMPDMVIDRAEDLDEPVLTLQPLAIWIGTLKRRRHAILDRHIAASFMTVAQDDAKLSRFEALLAPRLNEAAWQLIEDAVPAVLAGGEPVRVVYEWTSDPERPHAAERRDDAIVIRGPMLDFPVHEVTLWNERAEALFGEGGLILP